MNGLQAQIKLRCGPDFELDINSHIPVPGFTAVYGPSGCGKTSLLHCLAGLIPGDAGTDIRFTGQSWQDENASLPTHLRRVGYVFQDARLFPHLTVAGNLAYAEKRCHSRTASNRAQVCDWLQIEPLLDRYSEQLSRGQQQRVAIARALLSAPDILLMDEPLANLDFASRNEILGHLQRLHQESHIPVIYVSHDMEEVSRLADWLLVMERGRIVAQGPMLDLCSHLQLALAHEEQAAAIVNARVQEHEPEFGLTRLSLEGESISINAINASLGTPIRLRIPARDISVCLSPPHQTSILNILPVTIVEIEDSGASKLLLRLRIGDQHLLARLTRKSCDKLELKAGQSVYAQIKSAALLSEAYA